MPNKQRLEERQQARLQAERGQKMRTYLIVGGIAALVLILLGVLFIVQPFTGFLNAANATPVAGNSTPLALGSTPIAVGSNGCTDVLTLPDAGRQHLASPVETPSYQENPPTSGTHNPVWQTAGIYPTTQDLTMLVHSLEHGYVEIYHRDLSSDEYLKIVNLVRADPFKMIVNPYPQSPARIVMTAWDHMQQCNVVNEDVIHSFIAQFRDHGPEVGAQ